MINTHIVYTERAGVEPTKCLPFKFDPQKPSKGSQPYAFNPVLGNQRKADFLRLND